MSGNLKQTTEISKLLINVGFYLKTNVLIKFENVVAGWCLQYGTRSCQDLQDCTCGQEINVTFCMCMNSFDESGKVLRTLTCTYKTNDTFEQV